MPRRKSPVIPDALLDQLLAGSDAAAELNSGGLLDALKKALAERALNAEMDYHLGDEAEAGNTRNGYGRKTVTTDTGYRARVADLLDASENGHPQCPHCASVHISRWARLPTS